MERKSAYDGAENTISVATGRAANGFGELKYVNTGTLSFGIGEVLAVLAPTDGVKVYMSCGECTVEEPAGTTEDHAVWIHVCWVRWFCWDVYSCVWRWAGLIEGLSCYVVGLLVVTVSVANFESPCWSD